MWTWEHLILKNSEKKTLFSWGRNRTGYSWTWFLLRNSIGSRQQMLCCKRNIWGLPQILNDISAVSADRSASCSELCLHASCLSWNITTQMFCTKKPKGISLKSSFWLCFENHEFAVKQKWFWNVKWIQLRIFYLNTLPDYLSHI